MSNCDDCETLSEDEFYQEARQKSSVSMKGWQRPEMQTEIDITVKL